MYIVEYYNIKEIAYMVWLSRPEYAYFHLIFIQKRDVYVL